MKKELSDILKEASNILEALEHGKTYPADYIVKRFEKAASEHPTDQLIGNMRDVFTKMASRREYFHQKEIGKLYDEMYGLSGGQTAFRMTLEDLLPTDRQIAKVAHIGSDLRKMEENALPNIYADSELSSAFSVLFSLGGDSAFGTYQPGKDRSVQKSVMAKLSGLGYMPEGVDIIHSNEHFVLCSANYKTANLTKISTLVTVQITDGVTQEPTHIIIGGEAVSLDGKNLYTAIKEAERDVKNNSQKRFASERGDGSPSVEVAKFVVPKSLEQFADLENTLVAAASKFDTNKIGMAINMIDSELTSFGAFNPEVKISSSDSSGITFDVHIPTSRGRSVIQVPVEFHNSTPILPSRFAAQVNTSGATVFDFSTEGFQKFMSSIKSDSKTLQVAKHSGPLSKMSYEQLMDQMIEGVSGKDYKLAEDVLEVIESRFGSDQFAIAFDGFSQMLKHSSEGIKRNEMIKAAFEKGDLIKVPTSVELYCPKLGLTASKITFDEKGRIIPKGRRSKSDNQVQGSLISTNKVLFT